MKCAAGHGQMVRKLGELDLRIHGVLYLLRNITYEECPLCGEKVLDPVVSGKLFEKIKKGDYLFESIRVPVLDGAATSRDLFPHS
jgi:YgiT-type zinc finger domain-containing protein